MPKAHVSDGGLREIEINVEVVTFPLPLAGERDKEDFRG
jgi:hypothetical protein